MKDEEKFFEAHVEDLKLQMDMTRGKEALTAEHKKLLKECVSLKLFSIVNGLQKMLDLVHNF